MITDLLKLIPIKRILQRYHSDNISQRFTYKMAAKSSGIDMEQLLRHCHPMYTVDLSDVYL